jgi:hypothetical protein
MPQARARALRADDEAELAPRRRTVTITGHPGARARPAPRVIDLEHRRAARDGRARPIVEIDRRRPVRRVSERIGPRPDRLAMWALMMALFLILVVAVSPHG